MSETLTTITANLQLHEFIIAYMAFCLLSIALVAIIAKGLLTLYHYSTKNNYADYKAMRKAKDDVYFAKFMEDE